MLAHQPVTAEVRLALLGGFELSVNGVRVVLTRGSQLLLAYLAVNNRLLRRAQVAGMLWGDASEPRAAGNLRSTLWRLRQLELDLIGTSTESLRLSPAVRVDIQEAESIARMVFDSQADVTCLDFERLPFWGELLPGWDFEWVLLERERLRQITLHVLDALCERWTVEAQYEKAVKAGLAAVASEPLRESSHRALISAFLAEGNPSEAIRRFTQYCELLWRELKLRPSPRLASLVAGLDKA